MQPVVNVVAIWAAVIAFFTLQVTVATVVVRWLISLERRLGTYLTIAEHKATCEKSTEALIGKMETLNTAAAGAVEAATVRSKEQRLEDRENWKTVYLALDTMRGKMSHMDSSLMVLESAAPVKARKVLEKRRAQITAPDDRR